MASLIVDRVRGAACMLAAALKATPHRKQQAQTDRPIRAGVGFVLIPLAALLIAGCGWFGDEPEVVAQPAPMRTAYATFTPTPVQAPAVPTPVPDAGQAATGAVEAGGAGLPLPNSLPLAVVNAPSVNIREQPSVESDILSTVERGDEFNIVGRNALGTWWNVCCVGDQNGWIIGEFVDADGVVDAVAITDGSAPAAETGQSTEAAQPVEPAASEAVSTGGPTGGGSFTLINQEQFPESGVMRVYAYVYAGAEALDGYTVRVTHDGKALPVSENSFGGQPAFTWPFQDARQRYQNLKVEFPAEPAGGTWVIELVDVQGQSVGPAAQFTLTENDPNRELYVRYERP